MPQNTVQVPKGVADAIDNAMADFGQFEPIADIDRARYEAELRQNFPGPMSVLYEGRASLAVAS